MWIEIACYNGSGTNHVTPTPLTYAIACASILNLNETMMIASSLDYSFLMISLANMINLDSKICVIIIQT